VSYFSPSLSCFSGRSIRSSRGIVCTKHKMRSIRTSIEWRNRREFSSR
jgi:hypothetical protein